MVKRLLLQHTIFLSSFAMQLFKAILIVLLILPASEGLGQFSYSGQLGPEWKDGTVYLSMIEDYRKTQGVYPEQVVARTQPDSSGVFHFEGDFLPLSNRIYRIHVDLCPDAKDNGHFLGHCLNSRQLLFIGNNTDTLALPVGFEQQLFCQIVSTNQSAAALMRVDSVMHDMAFDMGPNPTKTARKLKARKWIKDLQGTAQKSNEPLAELYAYGMISDRTGELRPQYLADLESQGYYDELSQRVQLAYPSAPFSLQYQRELQQDRPAGKPDEQIPNWVYALLGICIISLLLNMRYIKQLRALRAKPVAASDLSPQEQKVLELIQQDKTNKEIAQLLFVSLSTVKTHVNNIYKKLGAQNREALKSMKNKEL